MIQDNQPDKGFEPKALLGDSRQKVDTSKRSPQSYREALHPGLSSAARELLSSVNVGIPERPRTYGEIAIADLALLEERIGYQFNDKSLLKALTMHTSCAAEEDPRIHEVIGRGERLRVFGHETLSFIIAHQLYLSRPEATEHELTRVRAGLLTKSQLAFFCDQMGLSDFIETDPHQDRQWLVGGEKTRSHAFSKLVGAVASEQGVDFAHRFFSNVLGSTVENAKSFINSLTALTMLLKDYGLPSPSFKYEKGEGDKMHSVIYRCSITLKGFPELGADGFGSSQTNAKRRATKRFLEKLAE